MIPEPPPLRVGVIGLRRGASLMRSCQAVGGATVTALFDPDLDRLQAAASDIGATAYRELDAFLDADIDLVVVASPMPFHAAQSVAALEAGKHVLCEVLPCRTGEEARDIVRAARASRGRFFVSENCIFYDEIELVRRLHVQGRFGEIYYGEGDYIHDCEGLWFDSSGRRTWRGEGKIGVYGTHGVGPLLYITGDRVTQVRCTALPEGIVNPDVPIPTMHLLEMHSAGGRVFRSRIDVLSPRPHVTTTTYRVQGTAGSYESATRTARHGRIWLRDAHEPSRYDASASWHELDALINAELADRRTANAVEGGHGTSEFWLLTSVFAAIRNGTQCPIELDAAFDFTLPCIVAGESAHQGGVALPVQDSRAW
jgi:predicted dehydrogenase